MEMNKSALVGETAAAPARSSGIRSWMIALVLGAVLTLAAAASVFAASPSADASASPASSSDDAGGTTEDSTDTGTDHVCDKADPDTTDTDASSS